ncbi:MAG TPA: EamA family transporter [Candidatus Nanoarchaeia archaeon]|nr:EamA family transporter [Candidatus Nanoarchaeia archaeon]
MTWILYALISAVFFAIYMLIFSRTIHKEHALEYLAIMSCLVTIFSFPLVKGLSFNYTIGTWLWLYTISILLTVFFIFLAQSFKHLESSEVAPLMNLALIFSVILSVLILRETISIKNWIGIALMVAGSYIIELGIHRARLKKILKKFKSKYMISTFIAIVASAIIVILEKIALNPDILIVPINQINPEALFFLTRVGMALNFIIILLYKRKSSLGITHALKTRMFPLLVITGFNIGANYIYYLALQDGPVSLVVTLSSLSTLLVVLIGGELFHEHHLQRKLLASILMIAATYLIVI